MDQILRCLKAVSRGSVGRCLSRSRSLAPSTTARWVGLEPLESRIYLSGETPLSGIAPSGSSLGIANAAEVHGLKWNDLDGDGVFEPENGETPLQSWIIYLDLNGDGILNHPISGLSACDESVIEPHSLTDQNGEYRFNTLVLCQS